MAVLLTHSVALRRGIPNHDRWISIGDALTDRLPASRRLPVEPSLEAALTDSIEDILTLCRTLAAEPSAQLAHTPAAALNATDFGYYVAWTRLFNEWALAPETTLVVCDDPWLFRHFSDRADVRADTVPPLWPLWLRLRVRGIAARLAFVARTAMTMATIRRPAVAAGGIWLLTYGHPTSLEPGRDGYFGDLPTHFPNLRRLLHVDCGIKRARAIASDGRTVSLHGWGRIKDLTRLARAVWRPHLDQQVLKPWRWLIQKAADRESATAQGSAIAWQIACQERFVSTVQPACLAWPWENHAWERALVRHARPAGTRTVGYQHSTIGRLELNYHAGANHDGAASLPDRILCTGRLARDQLLAWNHDGARLAIGGALRYVESARPQVDPAAPIFVALPFDHHIAGQLFEAVYRAAAGRTVVVKDHPMNPFPFTVTPTVRRATTGLPRQQAVSVVVYAATTVGLEAVLMRIPTIRFLARDCIALDILPNTMCLPVASADGLAAALDRATAPPELKWEDVFSLPDFDAWRDAFGLPHMPAATIEGRGSPHEH